MENERRLIPGFGKRYNFPENFHIEYDGFVGSINNQIVVKMVEKYENFVADQIAMEARASGVSDVTVLNKKAIMNALKKEIPQQVIMNENEIICPACRYDMMGLWDYPDVKDPNYCPICGQKLKWRTVEVADMREFAEDVVCQFGYYCQNGGRLHITHGGLSTLEWGFDILGWDNPHPVPEFECEIDGCHEHATCGTPTKDGYKRMCGMHYSKHCAKMDGDGNG